MVSKGLKVLHYFNLPYSPWSNGRIDRLGNELLRAFRSILSELHMPPEECPDLLPLVQSALNNAPSLQRSDIAPIAAFTAMETTTPVSTFISSSNASPITIEDDHRERAINVETLKSRTKELHPLV